MASYYFAYGADLDPEDLALRCEIRRRHRVRFAKSKPAVLKGFRLTCNIPSHYRQGGIFNIVPDPNDAVHGVVYELHAGDSLSTGIMKEGESTNYALAVHRVRTARGKNLQALVLRAEATNKQLAPSPEYLQIVLRAAQRHRLPSRWIQTLKRMDGKPGE